MHKHYRDVTSEFLTQLDATSFDAASALHWYAADHHDGQWSPLYAILSTLPYTPGCSERGPEGYAAEAIYDLLAGGHLDPAAVRSWIDAKYDAEGAA